MIVRLGGRYRIDDYLGSGVFSRAVACSDRQTGRKVCIKIVRNNKDFIDQSLGEVKLLRYLNANDPHDQMHVVRTPLISSSTCWISSMISTILIKSSSGRRHPFFTGDRGHHKNA